MIKVKYYLYLLGAFLVSTLILLGVFYRYSTDSLNDSLYKIVTSQVDYTSNTLLNKTKSIENIAMSILTDDTVRFLELRINSHQYDMYDYISDLRAIKSKIQLEANRDYDIQAIHIYWPEIELIISSETMMNVNKKPWIKAVPAERQAWINNQNILSFSSSYPYVPTEQGGIEYSVIIEMNNTFLQSIQSVSPNIEESFSILKLPQGDYLYTYGDGYNYLNETISSLESIRDISGENKNLNNLSRTIGNTGIELITYYDNNDLLIPINRITQITVFFFCLVIISGLILIQLFNRSISKNILKLTDGFKKVENGNFTTEIISTTNVEFNYVFTQFNQMTKGIDKLLYSFDNEYKRRSIAEIKQLQSQINPHFLYNSLFYLVSMADNPEAVRKMAQHLADYYKYRTVNHDFVTIEDEIMFAKSYLEIMTLRKFIQYKIVVDKDLNDEMILPLIIQPIIENAIQHGIEETEGANQIYLTIRKHNNKIQFSIEDDGRNIRPEQIKIITQNIDRNDSKNKFSIGLWNVNHRLKAFYGCESKIKLDMSESLGGLCVSFVIRMEDYEINNS
ncbi:sensor histidine kinase [Fundicoccus sp. Sow4_H7]|uniref:sensor histidine kinase n=1 Tax=Fundicoccus sp. Sow4_H7 TaxID=3438784 RepID=UPI003F93A77D